MFSKFKDFFRGSDILSPKGKDDDDDDGLKIYGPRILTRQQHENDLKVYKPHDTSQLNNNDAELKVARFMLYFSVSVLCSKIYFGNRKMFDTWSAKLLSLLSAVWQLTVDFNWFLNPLVIGMLVVYINWVIIYYDSKVPGVQPPSPFSASKTSGRRWHSCYIAAVANGVIFFIILLLLYK